MRQRKHFRIVLRKLADYIGGVIVCVFYHTKRRLALRRNGTAATHPYALLLAYPTPHRSKRNEGKKKGL